MTLDLVTGDDDALPRRWAASLHSAGHPGLTGSTRHDLAGEARTVVVFGSAGPRSAVRGWRTTTAALDDASLLARLTASGTGVLDRPRHVTARRPPGLTPR